MIHQHVFVKAVIGIDVHGMLLPPFGDLSHTSLLFYYNILLHYII
jgi:hypothetical protein